MNFLNTFITVLLVVVYAIPGYILVKFHAIKEEHIKPFSTLLMLVCQPMLTIYAFQKIDHSLETTEMMGMGFGFAIVLITSVTLAVYSAFHRKSDDVKYRVASICSGFGNVAFLGVPIMEGIMPEFTEGPMLCTVYVTAMTLLGWTLACVLITKDKKYLSIKRIIINPATLSLIVALILYFCNLHVLDIPYAVLAKGLDTTITLL